MALSRERGHPQHVSPRTLKADTCIPRAVGIGSAQRSMSSGQSRRRFRFQSSSRLLDSIDVATNVEVEQTLRNEAGCYTAQALQDWQELCCASEFNQFVKEVQGSCQTLAQVILAQGELIRSVLARLRYEFRTSLPAFLGFLKAVAHDLGSDFSAHLDIVVQAFVHIIDQGANHDAEVLDGIFSCLSWMCKICRKILTENPTQLISISSQLRMHPCSRVRQLAAAVVGFNLRSTPLSTWPMIYMELVTSASLNARSASQQSEFAEGLGVLLYHCISGAAHELQSDAFDRLRCVLFQAFSCTIQNEHLHTIVVAVCLRRALEHTSSGPTFEALGSLMQEALEGEFTNKSELVALEVLTLSVKFFRTTDKINICVDTFNVLISSCEHASIQVSATVLRARQRFVLEVAEIMLNSEPHGRCQTPSLYKIYWEGLVCKSEAEATFTFFHSLHDLFCKSDRALDGSIVANALIAARQTLSILGERSVQLVRKIILRLNSTLLADIKLPNSNMSSSKIELDFDASNLNKVVLDIYYSLLTKQRKWMFQIASNAIQDACDVLLQRDVPRSQNAMAVVTACLESTVIIKPSACDTCEDGELCVYRIIRCLLGVVKDLTSSPSAWSSWILFCDVYSEYFHRHSFQLRSRLIDPVIQTLDSENSDIRRSSASLLRMVAAGRLPFYDCIGLEGHENGQLANPLASMNRELDLFCMIHERTEMQGNILVHMKHCTSELSKLAKRVATVAKSDFETLILVKCCLGALHVRLSTLWPAVYSYLNCLEDCFPSVHKLVIDKLIQVQSLCFGDVEGEDGDHESPLTCNSFLDGEVWPRAEYCWAYLHKLLNYLASGEKTLVSRSTVGEYFLQYFNNSSAQNEFPRKLYDSCLVSWLRVVSTARGLYDKDDAIFEALHACLGSESLNVANGALDCMRNLESNRLSQTTIEYLRLLLNERTLKSTLTTRRICFKLEDDMSGTFYIPDKDRGHISRHLVQVLQRHAHKNDKRGVSSAALGALSIFETEEILPLFIKCLVGVVNFSELELYELLLDSLRSRRTLGDWLRLPFAVTGSSKTRLAFLRNLTGFASRLHHHLSRCPDIFFLIVLKIFTCSVDNVEHDAVFEATDEGPLAEKRARTVYRASTSAVASLFEHFHDRMQCYWPIISPSVLRLSERVHLQVSSGVPPALKITEAIVANPEALFAETSDATFVQDVSVIIRRSWSCLDLATVSTECRACIMHTLMTITEYAETPHSRFRERAQALLREESRLPLIVLNNMHLHDVRWSRSKSEDNSVVLERLALLMCADDAIIPDFVGGVIRNIVDMRRVDTTRTKRLLSVLVRILQAHRVEPGVCVELLPRLTFLLDDLRSHSARLELIKLFQLIAATYPTFAELVNRLEEMHAMRTDKIDEPDYLIRLKSYGQLTPEYFTRMTHEVAALDALLRQCMFDLKCKDFAVRLASRAALANFARAVDVESTNSRDTPLLSAMHEVIERSIPLLLAHRDDHLRIEGMQLLKIFWEHITFEFADLNESTNLQVKLCLEKACDIQTRHQSAALRELKQLFISCAIPESIVNAHFLPLLRGFLQSSSPDVTATALVTVVETIRFMSWCDYVRDVKRAFSSRRVTSTVGERYACVLLINIDKVGASARCAEATLSKLEAITILSKHIPSLEASMIEKSPEHTGLVNLYISHALSTLLVLLDSSRRDERLQAVVSKLADAFCSRSQKIRDSALQTLLCVLNSVPAEVSVSILQNLMGRMNKGFVRYVRAATIFACMQSGVLKDDNFALVLPVFVKIIEHDFFGDLYDPERGSAAREFCRECRKNYPLQSVFHIFRRVFDEFTINVAIRPVRSVLNSEIAIPPVRMHKLQTFFGALRRGLNANECVEPRDIAMLFFSVFSDCVKTGRGDQLDDSSNNFGVQGVHAEVVNSLAELSLAVIYDALKKLSTTGQRMSHQNVETIFFVLMTTLPQHGELQVRALGVMKLLLQHSPMLFRDNFMFLTKNVHLMLKSSSSITLRNSSYDILSKVLKAHHMLHLTEEFCGTLMAFTLEDITKGAVSQANFAILRVIIGRRIIIPVLYEVVERLIVLNATGSTAQLRESCSKLIVQFMLTYPVGERKVLALFDILLPNADYEHSQGRLSILTTIAALMEKLPKEILATQSESLLLVLLTKLSSEEDYKCRSLCMHSISTLIRRVSSKHRDRLFRIIRAAVVDESTLLVVAALQVLTKTIPEIDTAVQTYIQLQSDVMNTIITLADSTAATEVTWLLLYNYLALFEQGLAHDIEHSVSEEGMERKLCLSSLKLLRHDHIWVRTATCRVVYMFAFRSETQPSTVHRRAAHFLSMEDTFHAVLDVLKRFRSWGTSKEVSAKTTFSILQTLVRVSAVLLLDASKRRVHDNGNYAQPTAQRFHNAVTNAMYTIRSSTEPSLQQFSMRWTAALVFDLADQLEQHFEIVCDLITLCQHRDGATDESIRISNDVLQCLSRSVPNEMWIRALTVADSRRETVTSKRKRCPT